MKSLNHRVHDFLKWIEKLLLVDSYFPCHERLSGLSRLKLLWKYVLFRFSQTSKNPEYEIIFLLYSKACERMLAPLAIDLLQREELQRNDLSIRIVVFEQIYQLRLTPSHVEQLVSLGSHIEADHFSLIKACHQPQHKLVVLCLDQRKAYRYHNFGVDAADKLRHFSVKTISIQHGGTLENCMEELASSASDVIMVWGERTFRELTSRHAVAPERVRLVGNPLHDRLGNLNPQAVLKTLFERHPEIEEHVINKRIALLATRLHSDYRSFPNEQQLYQDYMTHLYRSVDASRMFLIIKMHPLDTVSPNLYLQGNPNDEVRESLLIVEPDDHDLDIYSLLLISDLVITRASTVAEEALLLGKKVIAFDMLANGPSRNNEHLAEYGDYTVVYPNPKHELRRTLSFAATDFNPQSGSLNSSTEKDLTYKLDGYSTQRASNEILRYLLSVNQEGDARNLL
jgi:hypothetical protein